MDTRSTVEQRLPVLLHLDRGSDLGEPSAQADSKAGRSGPWSPQSHFLPAIRLRTTPISAAGAAVANFSVACDLRHPLGKFPAGSAQLQPVLLLVRRSELGWSDLASDHLHQKPRMPSQRERHGDVSREADGSSRGQTAAQRRALLGGRDPAAGLGVIRLPETVRWPEGSSPLHRLDRARDSVPPMKERSGPKEASATSSSATRPTVPARILRLCWTGNPMPIQLS